MTIKWGIIGTGHIANTFAKAMQVVEDSEVKAVASRSKAKAEAFKDNYTIDCAYGSYEELVEDKEIDAVYIATPHSEHLAHARLAIEHGKHVLCEKPMTLNAAETKELIRLAKEHHVFLMEAMWTKFLPVTNWVKDSIEQGRIGEVTNITGKFGFTSEPDPQSRLYNPELGGGALLDVGIYPVMYAAYLVGRYPEEITSSMVKTETGVDAKNEIQFIYENGPVAELSSAVSEDLGTDAVITGTKGNIVIPEFYKAQQAEIYDTEGNCVDSYKEAFKVNGYEYEIREAVACIKAGELESKVHTLAASEELMETLDSIREQWGLCYPREIQQIAN